MQQTDRILVAAISEATDEMERIHRALSGVTVAGLPVKVDLLLVHNASTEMPTGSGAWLELPCLRQHHHVRVGNVDLFLTPPVQEFQLLNFGAYQELYDIGYEYTKKRLEEWSPP